MTTSIRTARVLPDTNVLVYAHDVDAGDRHTRAVDLIDELQRTAQVVVSTQVLNEVYWVITRPRRTTPLSHAEAVESIRQMFAAWEVIPLSAAVTLRALEAMPIHTLSFWDALIWSAAVEGVVSVVYTEDFQDGREIDGVRFVNPFAAQP